MPLAGCRKAILTRRAMHFVHTPTVGIPDLGMMAAVKALSARNLATLTG